MQPLKVKCKNDFRLPRVKVVSAVAEAVKTSKEIEIVEDGGRGWSMKQRGGKV